MSKYLYQTVYEQFTGDKPPEPQAKEERTARRGHGHPYRMRHNMRLQQQESVTNNVTSNHHRSHGQASRMSHDHNEMSLVDMAKIEARKNASVTKITYKKNRHIPDSTRFSQDASANY